MYEPGSRQEQSVRSRRKFAVANIVPLRGQIRRRAQRCGPTERTGLKTRHYKGRPSRKHGIRAASPSRRTFRKGREPSRWDFSWPLVAGKRDNFYATSWISLSFNYVPSPDGLG